MKLPDMICGYCGKEFSPADCPKSLDKEYQNGKKYRTYVVNIDFKYMWDKEFHNYINDISDKGYLTYVERSLFSRDKRKYGIRFTYRLNEAPSPSSVAERDCCSVDSYLDIYESDAKGNWSYNGYQTEMICSYCGKKLLRYDYPPDCPKSPNNEHQIRSLWAEAFPNYIDNDQPWEEYGERGFFKDHTQAVKAYVYRLNEAPSPSSIVSFGASIFDAYESDKYGRRLDMDKIEIYPDYFKIVRHYRKKGAEWNLNGWLSIYLKSLFGL